jgi:hypothetical protein
MMQSTKRRRLRKFSRSAEDVTELDEPSFELEPSEPITKVAMMLMMAAPS